MKQFILSVLIAGAACWAASSVAADPSPNGSAVGAVYTMDNSSSGNQVWVFARGPNGGLASGVAYPTGGMGTGSGLGSQGAVLLNENGQWLFVCNAGSDGVSVFAVTRRGLAWSSTTSSQGSAPISLTLHGNLLYVLNAGGSVGGSDQITGFLFADGQLTPLAGSTRPLSADNTGPAEVSFTSDAGVLVVTEKNTSMIDTFTVGTDGLVAEQKTFASPAATPFGFSAGRQNRIYVSNAAGSSLSSYAISDAGDVEVISDAVPTMQNAACWVALTGDGRFAYTANAASGSISGFSIAPDGSLSLSSPNGQTGVTGPGSHPIDMALSRDSHYLYSLDSGNGTITAFRVDSTGALAPLPGLSGISTAASGLAAR